MFEKFRIIILAAILFLCQVGNAQTHKYVDLGLPSGIMWATCNIGASSPEQYGNYYSWGETRTKTSYSKSTSDTYKCSYSSLKSKGILNNNGKLSSQYDIAQVAWGGAWRMPTKEEIDELFDNCTSEWTRMNGVYGCRLKSKRNGSTIFFPAAGYYDPLFEDSGSVGAFWSSTPLNDGETAYIFLISKEEYGVGWGDRCDGNSVRPVMKLEKSNISSNAQSNSSVKLPLKTGKYELIQIDTNLGSNSFSVDGKLGVDYISVSASSITIFVEGNNLLNNKTFRIVQKLNRTERHGRMNRIYELFKYMTKI